MDAIIFKIMIFLLSFSILYIIKECFMFYKALRKKESNLTPARMWGIGLALAFIITVIITGIKF